MRDKSVGLFLFQYSLFSTMHKEDKKMMASHKRKLIPRYHAYKPVAKFNEFIDADFIPQSWIYEFGYWRAADVGWGFLTVSLTMGQVTLCTQWSKSVNLKCSHSLSFFMFWYIVRNFVIRTHRDNLVKFYVRWGGSNRE